MKFQQWAPTLNFYTAPIKEGRREAWNNTFIYLHVRQKFYCVITNVLRMHIFYK